MSHRFRARYDGECDNCGADFDEGDLIGYRPDGDLVCPECPLGGGDDDLFDEFGPDAVPRPPSRQQPKPEPRQPFQGTSLDEMGY